MIQRKLIAIYYFYKKIIGFSIYEGSTGPVLDNRIQRRFL